MSLKDKLGAKLRKTLVGFGKSDLESSCTDASDYSTMHLKTWWSNRILMDPKRFVQNLFLLDIFLHIYPSWVSFARQYIFSNSQSSLKLWWYSFNSKPCDVSGFLNFGLNLFYLQSNYFFNEEKCIPNWFRIDSKAILSSFSSILFLWNQLHLNPGRLPTLHPRWDSSFHPDLASSSPVLGPLQICPDLDWEKKGETKTL